MHSPSPPPPDPSSVALQQRQLADLSRLDQDQNTRVKNILRSRFGFRGFVGGPLMRGTAGNSAGAGGGTAPASGAGGSTGGPLRGGGGGSGRGFTRGGGVMSY